MASSYIEYTGDGVQTNWTVPFPYLDESHVHVFANGVEVTTGVTWPSAGTVNVSPAIGAGVRIHIGRTTPDAPLVEFVNRVAINEDNLNLAVLQTLYRAVESADRSDESITINTDGAYDFGGARATNVGTPVDPTDLVNKQYADTAVQAAEAAAANATTAANNATTAANNAINTAATAAQAAEDAQAAANAAEADALLVDPENILHKDENLAGIADVAAARANIGVGDNWTNASTGHNSNNLDNLTTAGTYSGNLLANAPNGDTDYWFVLVIRYYQNNDYCLQIASKMKDSTAGETYIRILNNTVWGSWRKIATTKATPADFRGNVAERYLSTDGVWSAADEVAITYAASIDADFSTFINAGIRLTGDLSLDATNFKDGQCGYIALTQDEVGGHALTLSTAFVASGGVAMIELSTAANAVDMLFYQVRAGKLYVQLVPDWKH